MENMPEWYWKYGLHDARITKIAFETLDYDCKQRNPIRNYLLIGLDARGALYDTEVKSIKLFNAKVISGSTDVEGWFWYGDKLEREGGKYVLTVFFSQDDTSDALKISFDGAEVER